LKPSGHDHQASAIDVDQQRVIKRGATDKSIGTKCNIDFVRHQLLAAYLTEERGKQGEESEKKQIRHKVTGRNQKGEGEEGEEKAKVMRRR